MPTGKKLTVKMVGAFCAVNGKLVEGWFLNDGLDMFKQIGAIEITEKGKKVVKRDNINHAQFLGIGYLLFLLSYNNIPITYITILKARSTPNLTQSLQK